MTEANPFFHLRRLIRVATLLVFLVSLDCLWSTGSSDLATKDLPALSPDRFISTPVRQLGETGLIFYPAGEKGERRMLESRVAQPGYLLVEYRPTWPEHAGFALLALFALCFFWFCFSIVSEEWTEQRSRYVVKGKLTTLAALYFTYAVAAWLGWVWMVAWPFWVMGFGVLGFGAILNKLPTTQKPEPTLKLSRYIVVSKDSQR